MARAKRKRRDDKKQKPWRGGPRPFWSGTISFGLVNVPVELLPAVRSERISLRQLGPDGQPLSRRYICPQDHEAVAGDELIRGFPLSSGELVPIPDEELESLEPDRSRNIELERFVGLDELPARFFDRGYFLVPDEGGARAYHLLVKAMEKQRRAGIGTFVMRGKQAVIAILPDHGLLRGETLRFADEVRTPEDLGIELDAEPDKALTGRLKKALKKLEEDSLPEEELDDPVRERLLQLIHAKVERGEDLVGEAGGSPPEEEDEADVVDLMKYLKESLAAKESGPTERSDGAKSGDELGELSKKELYERAQAQDIEGRSHMSKDQLVAALRR